MMQEVFKQKAALINLDTRLERSEVDDNGIAQ